MMTASVRFRGIRAWQGLVSLFALLAMIAMPAQAQTFNCGSDGSDGALTFDNPAEATVLDFDPATIIAGRPLDTNGDGVYHFTSINIPANLTLRFRADKAGWGPVYFLSQGNVVIDGTLDLSGSSGHAASEPGCLSIPGPGGFPGGIGKNSSIGQEYSYGFGPSGNNVSGNGWNGATNFLYPLVGGSGGCGSGSPYWDYWSPCQSSGGGAGGGALLIASNNQITVNGKIILNGGEGGPILNPVPSGMYSMSGAVGGGGSLRILSPIAGGTGQLQATGGKIRIESNSYLFTGNHQSEFFRQVTLIPSAVFGLPSGATPLPQARLLRIGGVDVPAAPRGLFTVPDVVINSSEPLTFEISTKGIPLGTTFTIMLANETERTISFQTGPVTGTVEAGLATGSRAIPNGYTRGYVYATWTNP